MLDPKKIGRFARYLNESIPKAINDLKCDLDQKIKKILRTQINSMNLVDKEEFDLYTDILFKTQEKLQQIELKLKKLESTCICKLNNNNNNNNNQT